MFLWGVDKIRKFATTEILPMQFNSNTNTFPNLFKHNLSSPSLPPTPENGIEL